MIFIPQGVSESDQRRIEYLIELTEKDFSKKLPHSAFLDVIATNPIHQNRQDLYYLDPNCEEIIKDCQVLFFRDHLQKKQQSLVNEDQTHILFQKSYSLDILKKALELIIKEQDPSEEVFRYFQDQVTKNPKRREYFEQKGLSKSEASACALALSFYTGFAGFGDRSRDSQKIHTSDKINLGVSRCFRTCNIDANSIHSKKYFPVLHYLIKALAYIPFYWGTCIRHVELTTEEQKCYKVGSIVSWVQFTSSTKATTDANVSCFSKRNTILHIYSLSGRFIQPFSNFPKEEEVLFAPWCTFLVTKKEQIEDKAHIYLRQVELGTSKNTILWVDDKILDENSEKKGLMEVLSAQGLERNLRIIPKVDTKQALSFADSPFGQYISRYITEDFQIITNMKRQDEKNGLEAGALLMKELLQRNFQHKFTVDTSDEEEAFKAMIKHTGDLMEEFESVENYFIVTNPKDLLESVGFVAPKNLKVQQPGQQSTKSSKSYCKVF